MKRNNLYYTSFLSGLCVLKKTRTFFPLSVSFLSLNRENVQLDREYDVPT